MGLSECLCCLPWYHGSCYVNADRIFCQMLLFLIRNQHTVYIKVPSTLCIQSTVYLMYTIHKQMFVTTTTFYVLHTLMISLCSKFVLLVTLSSFYQHFSRSEIHVRCSTLSSADSTHFPEHNHDTENRNSHTPVFWPWWSPCFDNTHNIKACC